MMGTPSYGAQAFLAYLNLEHSIRMDYPANRALSERSSPVSIIVGGHNLIHAEGMRDRFELAEIAGGLNRSMQHHLI